MICSFHHTGEYCPTLSSIKILDSEEKAGFHVMLIKEDGQGGVACDGCLGLDEPMCLQYCREREELQRILNEFSKSFYPFSDEKGLSRSGEKPREGRL
jgi:hypothetical protein